MAEIPEESVELPRVIDLDLHIGDRVERLDQTGEAAWGTITGIEDDRWLVRDNAGVTQRVEATKLLKARKTVSRLRTMQHRYTVAQY